MLFDGEKLKIVAIEKVANHLMQVHADIDTVKVVVKNVPDYAAGKEKNDLGFLTFDLQVRSHALAVHIWAIE